MAIHKHEIRVYYEDTDVGGVVYYANYLRFIERGRSEMLRELGIDQLKLKNEHKMGFVVRKVTADYLAPAFFEDLLTVETSVLERKRVSLVLQQDVKRGNETLFTSQVVLVAVGEDMRPTGLPSGV